MAAMAAVVWSGRGKLPCVLVDMGVSLRECSALRMEMYVATGVAVVIGGRKFSRQGEAMNTLSG